MNPEFEARSLYDIYECTIKLRDRICGGTPKNKDLIAGWIKARTGHEDEITQQQTEEAIKAMVTEESEKSWNGFPGDEHQGIFVWSRQVKALFKECATMLRITEKKRGSKQIFQHGFEIKGMGEPVDRLYLGRKEADGFDEGPIHVQTAQGPRTALKRVDYVMQPELSFEIWVLRTHAAETRHVGEEEIRRMLTFGQENGVGADRSQGRGKFDVVFFKRISKAEEPAEEKGETKPKASKARAAAPS